MSELRNELAAILFDSDESSGPSNGNGGEGGEVSSKRAVLIEVQEIEAFKDGVEEVEGSRVRGRFSSIQVVPGFELGEELVVTLCLLKGGAVLLQEADPATAIELAPRDGVGGTGVGTDDLTDSAENEGVGAGVVEVDRADTLLKEAEVAFNNSFALGSGGADHLGVPVAGELDEAGIFIAGLGIMKEGIGEDAAEGAAKRDVECINDALSALVMVDNDGGVTASGLINDGLPVEGKAIAGAEEDINLLAIGNEHGARSELVSIAAEAEGLSTATRRDGTDDLQHSLNLITGKVE